MAVRLGSRMLMKHDTVLCSLPVINPLEAEYVTYHATADKLFALHFC